MSPAPTVQVANGSVWKIAGVVVSAIAVLATLHSMFIAPSLLRAASVDAEDKVRLHSQSVHGNSVTQTQMDSHERRETQVHVEINSQLGQIRQEIAEVRAILLRNGTAIPK